MAIEVYNELGQIDIADDVIATIVGGAALECYGLVGMSSRSQIKDGIAELLRRENLSKGIEVRTSEAGIDLDMYIIVGYGMKISEVANNVQTRVRYALKQSLGLDVRTVNIFVQGVRLINV
ncbi:Asp23/Gls24 family envelope stress response protein [Numidum massiliense]|uniref:Asp23/Gls24 family envelope stress response protein n=1 Tax=Numidum massiliense TaxID=1522315 RepID=UPI0006D59395|nr:Asp23/Gls24 family envelope stress response protein [Numidum massiliense]